MAKVNLYFSWKLGCLLGLKVTYGADVKGAQLIGIEKDLTSKDIRLGPGESITRVDVKEGGAGR